MWIVSFFLWSLAISRDIWCVVKIAFLNLICRIRFDRPIVINEASPKTPIVLVHGSSGNQSEWTDAIPYIRAAFPNHPVYAFSLDLPFDTETGEQLNGHKMNSIEMKLLARDHNWTIEQYVAELGKRIDYIKDDPDMDPAMPVILMGHSMGGLICAQYEQTNPQNVQCVIAFSSPFRGAPLLNHRLIKKCGNSSKRHRQMTPRSDFLASLDPRVQVLNGRNEVDARMRKYLTFGSPHDLQVPNECASLPSVEHYTIEGYGHFSIVKSPRVWAKVCDWFAK